MFAALTRFAPGAAAIVDDRGTLAADELCTLVEAERCRLLGQGATRVGLLAANGRSWAVTDLALAAAGLVNVPLPHHFGAAQMTHALQSAGVLAVATDSPGTILDLDIGFRLAGTSPQTGLHWLTRQPGTTATAYLPPGTQKVTYTSGSTADPKGVCLSLDSLHAVAQSVADVAGPLGVRRHLALLPLATLLENVAGLYAAWLAGATCHLPAAVATAISRGALAPDLLLAEVGRCRPETLILVPELLQILLAGVAAGWTPPDCARFYAVGGARVAPGLLASAQAAGLPVFEGYGLSECASVVCLNTPAANRRGSVGRPLPHARLWVDGRGEIRVSGALLRGYVGAADSPPAEFATGDLGEIDADGFVYVRGRLKNLFINSYGRNLSPEWIESELVQETAIGQAVVFGEARPEVVALIAPAHPGISAAALAAGVARANARLPGYARVARFHVIGERLSVGNGLLTGNGRPRRSQILARYGDIIQRLSQESGNVVS